MNIVAIVISLLISNQLTGFSHSSDKAIEVAWRRYEHPQEKKRIHLLGMVHWAPRSYYEAVWRFIHDKHVIYEGIGESLANRASIESKLNSLGALYKELFLALNTFRNIENNLGQIQQPQFDFAKCASCFCADEDMALKTLGLDQDIEAIRYNLRVASEEFLEPRIVTINNAVISSIVQKKTEIIREPSADKLFKYQREAVARICDPKNERVMKNKKLILENIAISIANNQIKDIAVPFGVGHLLEIELFLISAGWKMVEEKWHVVATAPVPPVDEN